MGGESPTLNLFCNCSLNIESTAHYHFYCPIYLNRICTILSTIENINNSLRSPWTFLVKSLFGTVTVIHLIQMLIEMFSMQLLSIFHLLKDFQWSEKNKASISTFCISCNSYLLFFIICRFLFQWFFVFPGTLTVLGTWWLYLLVFLWFIYIYTHTHTYIYIYV